MIYYRRANAGSGVLTQRSVFNNHEQVEVIDRVNETVCQLQIMAELNLRVQ